MSRENGDHCPDQTIASPDCKVREVPISGNLVWRHGSAVIEVGMTWAARQAGVDRSKTFASYIFK
jgi:hypothetical protein